MRMLYTLAVALLATTAAFAQPAGGGGGMIGLPFGSDLVIPDATVQTGTIVELPIHLADDTPAMDVMMTIQSNPAELQILALDLSAGLEQYMDDGGVLPTCDIVVETSGADAFLFMIMTPPYDPAVYGEHYMTLTVSVNAPAGSVVTLESMSASGPRTTTITVEGETPKIMRGDTNNDSQCDITDAVRLLEVLFQGAPTDCADTADVDDSGALEITDAVLLLGALFQGSPAIDESCARDLTDDALPDCTVSTCP